MFSFFILPSLSCSSSTRRRLDPQSELDNPGRNGQESLVLLKGTSALGLDDLNRC